jgi:hypothetical protein
MELSFTVTEKAQVAATLFYLGVFFLVDEVQNKN